MAESQDPSFVLDDALYCQEENWEEEDEVSFYNNNNNNNNNDIGIINDDNYDNDGPTPFSQLLFEQDLCWDDEELPALLSKEKENSIHRTLQLDPYLALARKEAVDWMLKVHNFYNFSLQTALLAVNYFDRFIFSFQFQREKQWMTQLASVACLSIAAKVEENHVPLLLDFQVEDSKYVFEAKTIQRMEMLVLSTLQWKMNPVTPRFFLDYLVRRLCLKEYSLCQEFLRRCERVLLSSISDSRFMNYLPSVMAAATILHIVNGLDPCIGDDYQTQVLGILGIDKEKVEKCRQLILESTTEGNIQESNKRKSVSVPGSPSVVIDVSFSCDSSNDSWAVTSFVSSSPETLLKKIRTSEDLHLERFNHPSVAILSIPR